MMMNNNYAKQQASKMGNSIERVINDKLEISFALNNPKYMESSEDRPNFYDYVSYENEKGLTDLTIEQYIDSVIGTYEEFQLNMTKIDNKDVIQAYLVDNNVLVFSVRPKDLATQLGINVKELVNLNYIKVRILDTDEVKYMWINDFKQNEDRKASITLSCSIDVWMTYYKDFIINQNGSLKVNRKLEDRGVLNDDLTISMNFNLDSSVNNMDQQFSNLTINIVKSTGWEVEGSGDIPAGELVLDDNRVYRYPYNEVDGVIPYVEELVRNGLSSYKEDGSQTLLGGVIGGNTIYASQTIATVAPTYAHLIQPFGIPTSDVSYGPKRFTLTPPNTKKYDYYYTFKLDAGDPNGDAYGIQASETPLPKTSAYINRVGNVVNKLYTGKNQSTFYKPRIGEKWRWMVKYSTKEQGVIEDAKGVVSQGGGSLEQWFYIPKITKGEVYLVDANTWDPIQKRFRTQYKTGGECSYAPSYNATFIRTWFPLFIPFFTFPLNRIPEAVYISFNGSVDLKVDNVVWQTKNVPGLLQLALGNQYGFLGAKSYFQITDPAFKPAPLQTPTWTITQWNEFKTEKATAKKCIVQQVYSELFVEGSNNFKDVSYSYDAEFDWKKEKKIRSSSIMKTSIEYLGVSKQIFNEFGGTGDILLTQNIYPDYCEDRIYTTNDNVFNNLNNTKGYLTKSYNNALPSTSDTYENYLKLNGSQMSNSMLTAQTNLDYQKKKEVLSNSLNQGKFINSMVQGTLGIGTSAAASAIGGLIGTGGNPAGAIIGGVSGGLTGTSKLIGQGILGQQELAMSRLQNEQSTFNSKQAVNQMVSQQMDLMNQPDQLNQGSMEVNSIIEYKKDLKNLYENYSNESVGSIVNEITFQVQTQAPSIPKLNEIATFYNKFGYIENIQYSFFAILQNISRTKFNYFQLENVGQTINANLPNDIKNWFEDKFRVGLRLWNVANSFINDYSKENWELEFIGTFFPFIPNKQYQFGERVVVGDIGYVCVEPYKSPVFSPNNFKIIKNFTIEE